MEEYARNFIKFCYPGIKGCSSGGPVIIWSERIKKHRLSNQEHKEVLLFCVYRVTDLINDEWEIKAYTFFLIKDGLIYFIKEEVANYEQEVVISNGQIFDFDAEEVKLSYSFKNAEGFKQIIVPKSKWKLIEIILEITDIPEGDAPEEIRKQFVAEKFPINLREIYNVIALSNDERVLIPRSDVIRTLIKSKKIDLIQSLPRQGDYIPFNHGCYKMY